MPTQAPTGSTSLSLEDSAILALLPGSQATWIILTIPSAISGTSFSKSAERKFGWVRERIIWGPRLNCFTSSIYALIRSPCLYDSLVGRLSGSPSQVIHIHLYAKAVANHRFRIYLNGLFQTYL